MTTPAPRPNRGPSAAAGNRAALLAAARVRFATEGLAAPLSGIARDAGVGQGSLYRHFPDRLALAVAVFEENLDGLEARIVDDGTGVADLLDLVEQQATASPGLVDLMWRHHDDERVAHLGARIADVAAAAVAHDAAAGARVEAAEVADVLAAISLLADLTARVSQLPDADGVMAVQARRARALVRRGLGIAD